MDAPGFRVSPVLARNDGQVVCVIPGKAGIHGQWEEYFVSEQRDEAIWTRTQRLLRRFSLLAMTVSASPFVQSFVSWSYAVC